jgi:hypothetical protein
MCSSVAVDGSLVVVVSSCPSIITVSPEIPAPPKHPETPEARKLSVGGCWSGAEDHLVAEP